MSEARPSRERAWRLLREKAVRCRELAAGLDALAEVMQQAVEQGHVKNQEGIREQAEQALWALVCHYPMDALW